MAQLTLMMMMTMSDSSSSILKASEAKLSKEKRKKNLSNVGRSCRNQQLANSLLFFVVAELHVSLKDTPPKKAAVICKKKNAKMTVETVETVGAAAPYSALIGHKLRPLLSDSQSALADCEEDVIQMCHLFSRNGKLSLVRLTKSFRTIPNLRGIANAYQNDERFKMWSVMLLCSNSDKNSVSGNVMYPFDLKNARATRAEMLALKNNDAGECVCLL